MKAIIYKCSICHSTHNLIEFKGCHICTICIDYVKSEN